MAAVFVPLFESVVDDVAAKRNRNQLEVPPGNVGALHHPPTLALRFRICPLPTGRVGQLVGESPPRSRKNSRRAASDESLIAEPTIPPRLLSGIF
jgi:hypothetical protein